MPLHCPIPLGASLASVAIASFLGLSAQPCRAAQDPFSVAGDVAAVDDATLAEVRGGFDLGGGLVMSLGIERTVSINGTVTSASSLNIADLSHLNAEQAGQAAAALGALTLVQNGAGNTFVGGPMPQSMGATVLQNSLSDQVLRTQTVISSTVNSAALLKTMNFQGSLLEALSGGLGVK